MRQVSDSPKSYLSSLSVYDPEAMVRLIKRRQAKAASALRLPWFAVQSSSAVTLRPSSPQTFQLHFNAEDHQVSLGHLVQVPDPVHPV